MGDDKELSEQNIHNAMDSAIKDYFFKRLVAAVEELKNRAESESKEEEEEETLNINLNDNLSTPTQNTHPKGILKEMTEKESKQSREKKVRDVSIERSGSKILVPPTLSLGEAVYAINLKMEQEENVIAVNYDFTAGVAEGLVAFSRVLDREFGFIAGLSTPGFFGRSNPPEYQNVEVGPGETETVVFGRVTYPGLTGWLEPTWAFSARSGLTFRVQGEIKGKHQHEVDALIEKVRQECRENSIYKGQAITAHFIDPDELRNITDAFPEFSKLSRAMPDDLVFERNVEDQIDVSLLTPIRHTERCRQHRIPLKRGILLEGPYGVGKTLTAAVTATLCKDNGWTFIYLKDVAQLKQAYAFAEQYQPAVIFAEDIDQVIDHKRDSKVNDVLNALDGIDAKGIEVITVLTTNHVEKITKAMLRPGRLDTVVSVRPPDAEAAVRLVKLYAQDRLSPAEDLTEVGQLLNGEIPALIREVVERSKLSALRREGDLKLMAEDLVVTARGMKAHMTLLKPDEVDNDPDVVKAAKIDAKGRVEAARITVAATDLKEKPNVMPPNGQSKEPVKSHV